MYMCVCDAYISPHISVYIFNYVSMYMYEYIHVFSVLAIPKFIPSPEVEVKLDNSGFYGRTEFLCQFDASTSEKDLLYEVIWYVNQGQLHGFASMEWSPEIHHKTRLTEDILARSGQKTVGFNVGQYIYIYIKLNRKCTR